MTTLTNCFMITNSSMHVSVENINAYLNKYYPDNDFKKILRDAGWSATISRQNGAEFFKREWQGNICDVEFEFFKKLAPYVDNGSYIEHHNLAGCDVVNARWSFENGKLVYYEGVKTIKWVKKAPPRWYR